MPAEKKTIKSAYAICVNRNQSGDTKEFTWQLDAFKFVTRMPRAATVKCKIKNYVLIMVL